MAIASLNLLRPPALPLATAPGILQHCAGRPEVPAALDPGIVRDLLAPVGAGHGGMSLFSSELAVGMASDDHSLVANAWPLDDPDTGELLAPKDLLLYVLGAMVILSFCSVAHIMMTGGFQQWKKRKNDLRAAMQTATARTRLQLLLEARERANPNTPVRQYLDFDNEERAIEVGLAVLTLWQDKILAQAKDQRWEISLVIDPAIDYIAPSLMLVAMPEGEYRVRRTESILARVGPDTLVARSELPTAETLLRSLRSLER